MSRSPYHHPQDVHLYGFPCYPTNMLTDAKMTNCMYWYDIGLSSVQPAVTFLVTTIPASSPDLFYYACPWYSYWYCTIVEYGMSANCLTACICCYHLSGSWICAFIESKVLWPFTYSCMSVDALSLLYALWHSTETHIFNIRHYIYCDNHTIQ